MSYVDQLARPIALVTARRLSRLQRAQPVEAEPLEDATDSQPKRRFRRQWPDRSGADDEGL